jgi:hypothetical protein
MTEREAHHRVLRSRWWSENGGTTISQWSQDCWCLTPAHERENSHGAALAWPWAASGPVSLRRHRWHKPRVSSSVTIYLCSNISALARRLGLDVTAWEVHGKRAGGVSGCQRCRNADPRIDRGHPMRSQEAAGGKNRASRPALVTRPRASPRKYPDRRNSWLSANFGEMQRPDLPVS